LRLAGFSSWISHNFIALDRRGPGIRRGLPSNMHGRVPKISNWIYRRPSYVGYEKISVSSGCRVHDSQARVAQCGHSYRNSSRAKSYVLSNLESSCVDFKQVCPFRRRTEHNYSGVEAAIKRLNTQNFTAETIRTSNSYRLACSDHGSVSHHKVRSNTKTVIFPVDCDNRTVGGPKHLRDDPEADRAEFCRLYQFCTQIHSKETSGWGCRV
jgi:hypothetical protein